MKRHILTWAWLCALGLGIRKAIKTFSYKISHGYYETNYIWKYGKTYRKTYYFITFVKDGKTWYTNYDVTVCYIHKPERNETISKLYKQAEELLRSWPCLHSSVRLKLMTWAEIPRYDIRSKRQVPKRLIANELTKYIFTRLKEKSYDLFIAAHPKYKDDGDVFMDFHDINTIATYGSSVDVLNAVVHRMLGK